MWNDFFPAVVSLSFMGAVFLVVFFLDLRRARDHKAAVNAQKDEFTKRSACTFVLQGRDVVAGSSH